MANYDLANLSVLIIDDSAHMRQLIKSIVTALGMRDIAEAENGKRALAILRDFQPDFIICDWSMEPMNGIEFTKIIRLKDDSPNPYVPIIMLTAHAEMNRVMIARDAGVNEFLAKPVSVANLYQRIRAIIEHPRQYVRTPDYFGPDRRRRADPLYAGPERRTLDL
jgi:CheY-like chemotaxis protein